MRSIRQTVQNLGISVPETLSAKVSGNFSKVGVDSRLVVENELFFALKGERSDGHQHLEEVQKRGALAAVVRKGWKGEHFGLPLLYVEDPLASLQEWAKKELEVSKTRIVAVTGSVGKTTSKEFIKTLLESTFRVAASPGNQNSQIGLPLAVLNCSLDAHEILVLEMGMTHQGQLRQLLHIAPPEVALLTEVALVHACNFDSIKDIAREKGTIFSHPFTQLGLVNREIPLLQEISAIGKCPKTTFSILSEEADLFLSLDSQKEVLVQCDGKKLRLGPFPFPGKHNLHNLLAAIGVARYFGVDWNVIREGISRLKLPEKRLEWIFHRGVHFLNDSYNACAPSMKAALEVLSQTCLEKHEKGRKIAVLGAMQELGHFSAACHQDVGAYALDHVEFLYCLGKEWEEVSRMWQDDGKKAHLYTDYGMLLAALQNFLRPGDVVLLKGAHSKGLWKILEDFVD